MKRKENYVVVYVVISDGARYAFVAVHDAIQSLIQSSGCDNNDSVVTGIWLVKAMWSGLGSASNPCISALALSLSRIYSFAVMAVCATSL